MEALQFDFKIPKYILSKLLGRWIPSTYWNTHISCLKWNDTVEPTLPNEDWVKVKVKYGGICGSDMNLLYLHDSPSTSPYVSFPFTIGHEAVGQISELGLNVTSLEKGQRVVVNPVLSCESRNVELCSACKRGDQSLCLHKTKGSIEPGLLIGACRNTGGSWSPYLVAHKSQIKILPDEVDDLNGVLVEPFSCALHAVLRNPPKDNDKVLIIGAGVIGLSVLAAIRALGLKCSITILVKHSFQGELAKLYEVDHVVQLNHSYVNETAEILNAEVLKPVIGDEVIQGGANIVYECVGKKKSINDSLRFAHSGGKVVLLGLAGMIEKIDWTTVWLNELTIKGCFAYSTNEFEGKKMDSLDISIELMKRGSVDLSPLITHKFPLQEYKRAFHTISNKRKINVMKVVFDHDKQIGGTL
ncbi:alcohol dehydrogenase catalytic domain-containing protein [Alkalihalophilus lindianensis]|uniref:Alcohol dehydrogenase catalytic domain-containing protein n=1 Tax=Alkalihalophilus lindianensis TaxID=1630542 RepID=A0ABU3XAZ2_9BACI|nr:alcohol dehydrogenase catalytic domain-containing protein [Alkalihalophilus lindianensis]MDV2685056.1 alcohol dehydrogenase catalytic domain-containing protein [Alkalihalophilus lindianensis]